MLSTAVLVSIIGMQHDLVVRGLLVGPAEPYIPARIGPLERVPFGGYFA